MKKKLKKLSSLSNCYSVRKKMLKASIKRNRRKTPYPFGFEYAKERK